MQTCIDARLVDPSEVVIDATHVKACANSNKLQQKVVQEEALFYEEQLKKEINEDRIAHGKKTPAIAKLLLDDEIQPLFSYNRPMTKEGFFRKHEYVYDEYYDCYICPANKILKYSSTSREG